MGSAWVRVLLGLSLAVSSIACESTPACGDSCDCPSAGPGCGVVVCATGDDCESGVCSDDGQCAAPSCEDGAHNGDELGLDCGGPCAACPACEDSADCAEGDCVDGSCVSEPGNGGAGGADGSGGGGQGGLETGGNGIDLGGASGMGGAGAAGGSGSTGGSGGGGAVGGSAGDGGTGGAPPACTSDCPAGAACGGPDICASGRCTGGVCAAPGCGDDVLNGNETAVDCGGGCPGCARGVACNVDADCASVHCVNEQCVIGPTAAFDLETTLGAGSFFVELSSGATRGDGAITSVQYRYGDGGDFAATASHSYTASGTFTITQLVTDQHGLTDTATRSVTVDLSGFTPVILNDNDRSDPEVVLSTDRLGMEVIDDGAFVGVRSNRAVTPGAGMFYFEGQRVTDEQSDMYFGVAPAAFPLDEVPGATLADHGFSVDIGGQIRFNGASVGEFDTNRASYGFVLDYRTVNPIVHVIVNDNVINTTPMAGVTEPLFIFVGGRRREVGEQARINTGNDTTNFPFVYDPVDALNDDGLNGAAVVLGWGQTRALPLNNRPSISVSGTTTVALGGSVTLTASVSDVEDPVGALSVHWVDLATPHATPDDNEGASWMYSPRALGIHPIRVTVTDTGGLSRSVDVDVTVTGALPQFNPVRLAFDNLTNDSIELSASGLAAKWHGSGKYGIRANQGMIGAFMYFEMHRLIAPNNQGGGLVIAEGNLDPYSPRDIPPSCSVNHSASIWRNLISEADYDTGATEHYGFAVDYRGRHPIVYVITRYAGPPVVDAVSHVMELDDVTVPIYPMLYGNPTGAAEPFDAEINFGATPFNYNPVAVLQADGVDTTELVVGWGDANR